MCCCCALWCASYSALIDFTCDRSYCTPWLGVRECTGCEMTWDVSVQDYFLCGENPHTLPAKSRSKPRPAQINEIRDTLAGKRCGNCGGGWVQHHLGSCLWLMGWGSQKAWNGTVMTVAPFAHAQSLRNSHFAFFSLFHGIKSLVSF